MAHKGLESAALMLFEPILKSSGLDSSSSVYPFEISFCLESPVVQWQNPCVPHKRSELISWMLI